MRAALSVLLVVTTAAAGGGLKLIRRGEREERARDAAEPKRNAAHVPARHPGLVTSTHGFERDLRSGVSGADEQHAARLELREIPIFARVQLDDRGIEVRRKPGNPRLLEGGHRDDDVLRLVPPTVGGDEVAIALTR